MKHLKKFNEDLSIDKDLPLFGIPLNTKEQNLIKNKVWGSGFLSKFSNRSYYLDDIVKYDNQYYIDFYVGVCIVDDIKEVCEIVYIKWCLKKNKFDNLGEYLPKSKLIKKPIFKNLLLKSLEYKKNIHGVEDEFTKIGDMDIHRNVIDLIRKINLF
jgi:hypothetical protein